MKIFRRPLSALAAITARLAALEKNGVSLPLRLSAQQPITYTLFTVAGASLGYSGPLDAHYRALKAVTFKVLQGATYWPIGNVIQVLDASKTVIASGVWAANPDQQAELPVLLALDNPVVLAAGADFYLRVLVNPAVVDSNRGAGTTSTDGSIKFLDSATMTLPALNFLSGPLLPKQTIQPLDPADFPVVTSAAQLIGAGVALLDDGVAAPRLVRKRADGSVWLGAAFTAPPTGYKVYRLNITAGGDGNYSAVSELQLRSAAGGASVAQGGVASDNSRLSGDYPGSNAFDNDATSSWISAGLPSAGSPKIVTYTFPNAVKLVEYAISVYVGARGPHAWTFEGSPDGAAWTVLDTQTGQVFADGTARAFPVANG